MACCGAPPSEASIIELAIEALPPAQQPQQGPPACERRIDKMFWLTLLPTVRHPRKWLAALVPTMVNAILGPATFCMLYYPAYYPTQGIVWSTDTAIIWVTYNYMLYLQRLWHQTACFEHTEVPPVVHRVSFTFYVLYLIYWLYFAVIQFATHSTPSVLIQLGNTLMSTAWYFFFSTVAVIYYYICVKLSQRAESVRNWIRGLKQGQLTIESFYIYYNVHNRRAQIFGKNWNFVIFTGFLLLTFHVPIDLISVMYNKYYYDIFGLVIKLLSLIWYLARICDLNDCEALLLSHLYKHRVFPFEQIRELELYMQYRPIALDFYGIKINKGAIVKVFLLGINLLVPTLYALASNEFFKGGDASPPPQNTTAEFLT
jgi:hypothetical protein